MTLLARSTIFFSTLCFALLASATHAAGVQVQMEAFIVTVDDEGNEQFNAAETAEPGEVVEYRLYCSNDGDKSIRGWAVTGPIPASTEYVTDSARTEVNSELRVSVDGGKTWGSEPMLREVKQADGSVQSVVVPSSEYSHLRWFAKERLGVNEVQQYFYRVRVLSDG